MAKVRDYLGQLYSPRLVAGLAILGLACWLVGMGFARQKQEARRAAMNTDGIIFDASELPEATTEAVAARPVLTHIGINVRDIMDVTATIYDNAAGRALVEHLRAEGPLALEVENYNQMERFGQLPWRLPEENETLHTAPGDITLYQGNQLAFYYAANSWSLTPIGQLDNIGVAIVPKILLSERDDVVTLTLRLLEPEELLQLR